MLSRNLIIFIILTVFQVFYAESNQNDNLIIKTNNGFVTGFSYSLLINGSNTEINAWFGIPFAEKPINDLRFKRPLPVKNWITVLNATKYKSACIQITSSLSISEDCLYLNIWRPVNLLPNSSTPVLVYIHGGSLIKGSSQMNPEVLITQSNIIYVSIQYRLSIFGFLYLDQENAPGNMAFLDQTLALKWIYENIGYFGGDNSKITISGQSAGAISVGFHLLSNLSSDYYRNAILESGSPQVPRVMTKKCEAIARATNILKSFNCTGSTIELIDCAKKIDALTVLQLTNAYMKNQSSKIYLTQAFSPVVDNYFLMDEPLNLLKQGNFKRCAVLAGINKDEGNYFLRSYYPEFQTGKTPIVDYERSKAILLDFFYFFPKFPLESNNETKDAILFKYTNWNDTHDRQSILENLDFALTDWLYLCPNVQFLDFYTQFQEKNIYQYYFVHNHTYPGSAYPSWMGAYHGSELKIVYGDPFVKKSYNQSEKELSLKMIRLWSNFVKYENPNGNEANQDWPIYNHTQKAYIVLKTGEKFMIDFKIRAEYCSFWLEYVQNIIKSSNSEFKYSTCAYTNEASSFVKFNYRKSILFLSLFFSIMV